jgi:hypothetical protein
MLQTPKRAVQEMSVAAIAATAVAAETAFTPYLAHTATLMSQVHTQHTLTTDNSILLFISVYKCGLLLYILRVMWQVQSMIASVGMPSCL